jgi:fatty acid desaturase
VRELSRLKPRRVVGDVVGRWTWILAAWTMVGVFPRWWVILLSIPIIGSQYYALMIIGHDGLHRRLFARKRTNDLFNDLLILGPIGAITRLNNANHLGHHLHLATAADPDRHKHGCFNKPDWLRLLGYLSGLTSIRRTVLHVFWPTRPSRSTASAVKSDRYQLRDFLILVGWQAMLVGGLTYGVGVWGYPLLWLVPVYLFAFLPDNLRSFLEHSHPEADSLADNHRLISYRSNWIERQFLSPMNMNCHAAHHLWPSIPYYHLTQADEEMRCGEPSVGIVWRGTYLGYLWRYFRTLPLEDCIEDARHGQPLGRR